MVQRVRNIIFTNRKFGTIHVPSTLDEKTEFCKKIKFGSVTLAFHYGSCFNTILSLYTLHIFLYLKS